MKRMLLTISYDGSAYCGWQVQPNGITVQETLQNALLKLTGERTNVTGCSRTDAGVHAREFCCHIDCADSLPESAFLRGLSALLPSDIAVKDCTEVPRDFHARYNARGKTYAYYILNSKFKNPFLCRYTWRIERPLNIDKMNEFCTGIIGTHDFAAFSSSARSTEDTVRTVTECNVTRQGDTVVLRISANGFLYNMVRIITGTAVVVSDGRVRADIANTVFKEKKRSLLGETAPPQGLFLEKVLYNKGDLNARL